MELICDKVRQNSAFYPKWVNALEAKSNPSIDSSVKGEEIDQITKRHGNPNSEVTVRNPLPATLWFLQHDARQGLLEANGFERSKPVPNHPPVFRQMDFYLHSRGFWLEQADSRLVYRNPSRSFYRLPKERDPLSVPEAGEERVSLEEGFCAVREILQSHESFVQERCGKSYRSSLLQMMPVSDRRYGKNWKLHFGLERRPSLHM